jgi:hypothetical protein
VGEDGANLVRCTWLWPWQTRAPAESTTSNMLKLSPRTTSTPLPLPTLKMNLTALRPVFRPLAIPSIRISAGRTRAQCPTQAHVPASTSSFSSTAHLAKRSKGPGQDPRIGTSATHFSPAAQPRGRLTYHQYRYATTSPTHSHHALCTSPAHVLCAIGPFIAHGSSSCESDAPPNLSNLSGSTCRCALRVNTFDYWMTMAIAWVKQRRGAKGPIRAD